MSIPSWKIALFSLIFYFSVSAAIDQATEADEISDNDPGLTPEPGITGFSDPRPLSDAFLLTVNDNRELILNMEVGEKIILRTGDADGIPVFWYMDQLTDAPQYETAFKTPQKHSTLQLNGFKAGLGRKSGQQTFKFDARKAQPATYVATFQKRNLDDWVYQTYHFICYVSPKGTRPTPKPLQIPPLEPKSDTANNNNDSGSLSDEEYAKKWNVERGRRTILRGSPN